MEYEDEYSEDYEYQDFEPSCHGYEDDAYALASAGWGTDEDYGFYGNDYDY